MSCVIYTCHNVVPLPPGEKQRGTIDLNTFLYQLRWLNRLGVRFIPMNHFQAWLQGKKAIPKRAAVLTFDDALVSISENVFEHLKHQAIPMTIFVIASLIGRESHFSKHPDGQMRRHLDLEQLKMLLKTGLVEVGGHGYNHRDLTLLEGDELEQEIGTAKDLLEEALNVEVPYFAYPWGKTTQAAAQKVKETGYKLAFTTRKQKIISPNIDAFFLPRVNWGRRTNLFKLCKYYLIPWMRSAG